MPLASGALDVTREEYVDTKVNIVLLVNPPRRSDTEENHNG